MKVKLFISVFLFLFLQTLGLYAQERNSYFETDYAYGSILKHKKIIGHLVLAHPSLIILIIFTY